MRRIISLTISLSFVIYLLVHAMSVGDPHFYPATDNNGIEVLAIRGTMLPPGWHWGWDE